MTQSDGYSLYFFISIDFKLVSIIACVLLLSLTLESRISQHTLTICLRVIQDFLVARSFIDAFQCLWQVEAVRLWRGLFGPCRVLTCLLQLTSLGCLSSSGPFLLAGESSDFTPRRFIVTTFEDSSEESSSVLKNVQTYSILYNFNYEYPILSQETENTNIQQ